MHNENSNLKAEIGEKRRFKRIEFHNTDWAFCLDWTNSEGNGSIVPDRIEACNISMGGVKFIANQRIPVFTKIAVKLLPLSGLAKPIRLKAKINRVEETDLGLTEKTYGFAAEILESISSDMDRFTAEMKKLIE